jgi:tetratricopeptide (TPR) repeat protein
MRPRAPEWFIGLLLAVLTVAVFAPAVGHDFVSFDDDLYVSDNAHVLSGLTWPGLRWAWTTLHAGYYQPVTWLSFQLDAQLFGPRPWGFHLSNVLWHAANVVLLFVVLRRLTGAPGRSAAVAALFAVHPLHVESVAWVTERKDVLSTFFALLAIWAYSGYIARPGVVRYLTVLAAFAFGLLAKPMVVTLPFVLLLLDFWPGRRAGAGPVRLVVEKLPLFAMAAGMAALTVYAHSQVGGLVPAERLPLGARLANAVVAYVWYLGKTFWPAGLAPFYPHPGETLPGWQVAGSALLLLTITVLALGEARRRPYLPVGWLWFLGTLVPVIGLVQAGEQAVADRFSYYPHVGLFLLIVWGAAELLARRTWPQALPGALAAAVCLGLAVCTWRQLGYWTDSVTVLEHALRVAEDNPVAHNTLGTALARQRRLGEAAHHFSEAVRLDPDSPKARLNLGQVLLVLGKPAEAVPHYRAALRLYPGVPTAHFQLGVALVRLGQTRAAIEQFAEAARLDPAMTYAHYNLGLLRAEQGDAAGAIRHFRAVLDLDPGYTPTPHSHLGKLYTQAGRLEEAVAEYRAAQRLQPENPESSYQLGRALARRQKWAEAEAAFRHAVALRPEVVHGHCALARALSRQGRDQAAREEYRAAFRLDPNWPRAAAAEAWALATDPDSKRRDGRFAEELAEQACEATENREARLLDVLASAYAEVGQFDRARATASRALALATAAGDEAGAREIAQRLESYRRGQPHRAVPETPRRRARDALGGR